MGTLTQQELADFPTPTYRYERHRPESTLLYQIIQEHWLQFQEHVERQGRQPPVYVVQEFEEYLKYGFLQHGFLRVRCQSCQHEKLVVFSCKHRGVLPFL